MTNFEVLSGPAEPTYIAEITLFRLFGVITNIIMAIMMARYNDGAAATHRRRQQLVVLELRAGAVSGKVSTKMAHEEYNTSQFLLFSRVRVP